MPLLDVTAFSGKEDSLLESPESELLRRRSTALSMTSRCLFKPRCRLPVRGSRPMVPDKHQLLALDSFGTPWLGELLVDNQNLPKYERDTVIIADEGGMGRLLCSNCGAKVPQ